MSKEKLNIKLNLGKEGDVKITIAEEAMERIPRAGQSIYVIEPYPVDDDAEEDEVKEKPILAYSYAGVMVKATVLNDDLDECLVNGDFKIPLYKNAGETNKKIMVFTSEEEAQEKWLTLMEASLKVAEKRTKKAKAIEDYVAEAIEKAHH